MKNNKKGFTLVEILAAVTILGIISVIAIVSVTNVIEKAKVKHYTTAEEQLRLAGQSYAQQNRAALPKAIGQKTKIPLKVLVNTNYIEPIKDYSDNKCDLDNSYVQVFKYSQTEYSYLPYLDCPVYDSEEEISKSKPTVTVTMSDDQKTKKASVSMSASDSEKLLSWSYIVYKADEEVFNSGSVMLKNYDKTVSKTLDLSKYTPGKLKVVVTATNIYGITTTKTATTNYNDNQKPTCIIKPEDKDTMVKPWTKNNVTITVGCDDGDGAGCKRAEYTKTFKSSVTIGTITIEDKSGNTNTCRVSVYLDKTPPNVPTVNLYNWKDNGVQPNTVNGLTAYTPNTWTNKNVYIKASNSTDANSGLDYYEYKTTGKTGSTTTINQTYSVTAEGTSTIQFRACDKAGNCSAYSTEKTIKLDKTAPSNPTVGLYKWKDNSTRPTTSSGLTAYTANTWSNKKIFTTATGSTESGDVSGFKEYQFITMGRTENLTNHAASYRNIEAQGLSYIKYRACDYAGNCTSYTSNQAIKIDTVAPTITNAYNSAADTWVNRNVVVSANYADATSGVAKVYYRLGSSTTEYTDWDSNTGSSVSKTFTTSQNKTITIGVIDNAGNKTEKDLGSLMIDKVAPTVPTVNFYKWKDNATRPTSTSGLTTYSTGTWSNKHIYAYASGSTDSDSGFDHYEYTTTGATTSATNKEGQSRSIEAEGTSTIKFRACDKAGNCSAWSTTYTVKVDTVAPTITDIVNSSGGSWTSSNVTISANVSDATSGVAAVYYRYKDSTTRYSFTSSTGPAVSRTWTTGANGETYLIVRDNAGNETEQTVGNINIDSTNPTTPTVNLYKWKNNSTRPTSSSGLTAYTSNTWTNKKVFVKAGSSTDTGSGVKNYQYTTTGTTTNYTNKVGSYVNIESEGTSYVKYRSCDNAENCSDYSTQYIIKIDTVAPSITNVYNSSGGSFSSSPITVSANYSDATSGISSIYYRFDGSTTKHTDWDTNNGSYVSKTWSSDISETVYIGAIDNAGNSKEELAGVVNMDNTSPDVPTVILSTTSNGSQNYVSDTWSTVYIYTRATGSDGMSDFSHYEYTTTGKTTNNTNKEGSSRAIQAEGISTIKYRACDTNGNCSDWTPTYTIKIDSVAPSITNVSNGSSSNWTNTAFKISANYSDATSGVARVYYKYSDDATVRTDWDSDNGSKVVGTWSAARNQNVIIVAEDNAGNVTEKAAGSVKIDKTAPTCTDSGDNTTWTKNDVTLYWGCSDTGGSGCNTSYDGSSIKLTASRKTYDVAAYTIKDNAGNSTSCPARTANVYIDKTAPSCTTTTTNSYWTNENVTLTGTCSDAHSGCDTSTATVTQTYTTEMNEYKSPGVVKDKLGNETTCSTRLVRIDKTPPYIYSVSLANAYMTQWDTNSNELTGSNVPFIKNINCTSPSSCTADLCIVNKLGSFQIYGQEFVFKDDLSGYYYDYYKWKMYDKNDDFVGENKGCISTKGHNPCRYEWTYTAEDYADNTSTWVVNYRVGYIGLDSFCN